MEFFDLASLTEWLHAHQKWLLVTIFLAAFFESLAIVGIIIPGIAILFALATIAGNTDINLFAVLAAGSLGAIAGDCLSFSLGYHYKNRLHHIYPFNRHPNAISKGHEFFLKHGMISVVIGRFVGPIRPVIPLVAGSLAMQPSHFISINILSALAWSPFYLLPGYWVGKSVDGLPPGYGDLARAMVLLIAIIWLSTMTMQLLWRRHCRQMQACPTAAYSQTQLIVFCSSGALMMALALIVSEPQLNAINLYVTEYLQAARISQLDPIVIFFTGFGTSKPVTVFSVCLIGWLFYKKQLPAALAFSTLMLLSPVLIFGLKALFNYPRPDIVSVLPAGTSFPSGHATISTMSMGYVCYLLLQNLKPEYHFRTIATISTFIIVMAFSRLYLGVHWLTDVIAGIALGIFVLIPTFGMQNKIKNQINSRNKQTTVSDKQPLSPKSLSLAALIALGLAYIIVVIPNFDDKKLAYQVRSSVASMETEEN